MSSITVQRTLTLRNIKLTGKFNCLNLAPNLNSIIVIQYLNITENANKSLVENVYETVFNKWV